MRATCVSLQTTECSTLGGGRVGEGGILSFRTAVVGAGC